jgi:hypothetical protein
VSPADAVNVCTCYGDEARDKMPKKGTATTKNKGRCDACSVLRAWKKLFVTARSWVRGHKVSVGCMGGCGFSTSWEDAVVVSISYRTFCINH